jgi:beta-lactamase class A
MVRRAAVKPADVVLTHDPNMDAWIDAGLARAGLNLGGSAYISDLERMRFGQWRAREAVYPASVIKVPIMAEAYRRYADGSLDPGLRVTVSAANQTATSGPAPFSTGYETTIHELVEYMVVHSDNVATNQLMDELDRARVTTYMHQLGLSTFLLGRKLSGSEPFIDDPGAIGRNQLPAIEIARLLELIACEAIPKAAEQRELLRRCADSDKLVPGLARDDVFCHKTGETESVSHDAGILITNAGKRYVVVLYCEVQPRADHAEAGWINPAMTAWMRAVRDRL